MYISIPYIYIFYNIIYVIYIYSLYMCMYISIPLHTNTGLVSIQAIDTEVHGVYRISYKLTLLFLTYACQLDYMGKK